MPAEADGRIASGNREHGPLTSDTTQACDLCDEPWDEIGRVVAFASGGIDHARHEFHSLLRCDGCGSLRLDVGSEAMRAFLVSSQYNESGSIEPLLRARLPFLEWICERYLEDLPSHARVLDFGSSYGLLSGQLVARGFDVTGVELCSSARDIAAGRLPDARMVAEVSELVDDAGSFDCVLAIDSLYYLAYPRDALRQFVSLLGPDGLFIARCTHAGPRDWRYRAGRLVHRPPSRPLGDALWAFSPEGLVTAMRNEGMGEVRVSYAEGGKTGGWRGRYYTASGKVADLTRGRIALTPGFFVTGRKR